MKTPRIVYLTLAVMFAMALSKFDAGAQTVLKFTTLTTESIKDSKSTPLPDRDLEIKFTPRIGNQPPFIRFSATNPADPNHPAGFVWFMQGKTKYYFFYDRLDDKVFRRLTLYSNEFDTCVSVLQPMYHQGRGYVVFSSKTDASVPSIWCDVTYNESVKIMTDVCHEVERLNIPKTNESMTIDIDW